MSGSDDDMNAREYEKIREAFGFSQETFGVWLGFSPRTGQRFSAGEKEIPKSVAMLLRTMVRHHITIAEAEKGEKGA